MEMIISEYLVKVLNGCKNARCTYVQPRFGNLQDLYKPNKSETHYLEKLSTEFRKIM